MAKTKLIEKIGYGFGDMSSSTFWKIFSYYLPFFYSNIFGLSLIDAGVLVLITRIWDAVSDPMMGIICDRTNTKWGKYRPYLLWVAPFFSICGILLFTTPDWAYGAKLTWAYVTYIMMMTVYTGINVPYGAMLGVMTDDSNEKTVFSVPYVFCLWRIVPGTLPLGASYQYVWRIQHIRWMVLGYGCYRLSVFRDVYHLLPSYQGASEDCVYGECR